MIRSLALAVPFLALCAVPGLAAPFCVDDQPGIRISSGVTIGGTFTWEEIDQFDMMQLRQAGIDATRVERWNGCIRAWVRKPGGGEEMQFFQPRSYVRVY